MSAIRKPRNPMPTPGPWEWRGGSLYRVGGHAEIMEVKFIWQSDADLIAAAPDLLAALEAVIGEWREGYGLNCVEQVRAAINKARGEA